jgi:serine/threonine-protein phosphatase 2A regulatory subunit B'
MNLNTKWYLKQSRRLLPLKLVEDSTDPRGRRTRGAATGTGAGALLSSGSITPQAAAQVHATGTSTAANVHKGKEGPKVGSSSVPGPGSIGTGGTSTSSLGSNARAGAYGIEMEVVQVKTPGVDRSALKELPALRDAPPAKREELFVMKLKLCSVIFSFDDQTADKRGKDMKRQTLLELVDYVNTPSGQKIFTESIMGDLMAMVSANVCRALPPATDDFDPEEDEPVLEPAWPHLQVAYEFFLRFIVSSEVNAKAAKKYVDQKFCLQLVELFDSEDPRERDYLKTILHRIYGKFMSHRSFIRRAISNVFYRFVYETERHNGIGELLEILGSIINGFAIPLKKEHLQFLVRALIPLHKPKCVALYHQQLSYCIIQYVEKDADTATPILNGFFKCWPWSCSGKQVMFLNELEEILELLGADQLAQVSTMLFTNLARCLDSDHFQVVERALFLWNNEHLVNSGCLSRLNASTVLPIIYGPLYKNSSGHWNATVEGLAQNVLKMYMEYDLALYDKCTAAYFRDEEEAKKRLEALQQKWNVIELMAQTAKLQQITSQQQAASAIVALSSPSSTGAGSTSGSNFIVA